MRSKKRATPVALVSLQYGTERIPFPAVDLSVNQGPRPSCRVNPKKHGPLCGGTPGDLQPTP